MTDPTPIERAEEAVCDRIVKTAGITGGSVGQEEAQALKSLAEGVAAMKHGPQGGDYSNTYEGRYSSTADNHSTDHQGEERSRPGAGFS